MNGNATTICRAGFNPEEVLDTLFDGTALEYLREELWYFLKAVVAEDYFRFRGQPVIVCEVAEHLEQIIELFQSLHLEQGLENISIPDDAAYGNADRDHLLTLKEIEEKFAGKIRRLRKDEIENLNLVIKKFFNYHPAERWKEELRNWQYYALSTGSICIASDDTSMLETYEQLERILEAAYLLHKRKSLQYRYDWTESESYFGAAGGPVLLTVEEWRDPLAFICDYFGGTTLSEHTQELAHWIEAVVGDMPWDHGPPAELLYFHEEVTKLLEAALALQGRQVKNLNRVHQKYPRVISDGAGPEISSRFLSHNECRDPSLVLQQLTRNRLKSLNEELKNWLYHALSRVPIEGRRCDLSTYHLLQKLSEALYLLCLQVN